MEKKKPKVRVQAMIDPEILEVLDRYAGFYNLSRSGMVYAVLSSVFGSGDFVQQNLYGILTDPQTGYFAEVPRGK